MTVTWTAPTFNGGSEITGYILERCDTSSETWIKVNKEPTKDLTFKCTDLKEGSEYEFRVVAENKAGLSKPSDVSDRFTAKPPYGEISLFQCSLCFAFHFIITKLFSYKQYISLSYF